MANNNKNIQFFEWSDLNRQPIQFNNTEDFINFCNVSNIKISKLNLHVIKQSIDLYAICERNNNVLVLSSTYKGLRKNFNKHCNKR